MKDKKEERNKKEKEVRVHQTPTFGYSLTVLLACAAMIIVGTVLLGAKLQLMFLLCLLIVVPAGIHLGYTYEELES